MKADTAFIISACTFLLLLTFITLSTWKGKGKSFLVSLGMGVSGAGAVTAVVFFVTMCMADLGPYGPASLYLFVAAVAFAMGTMAVGSAMVTVGGFLKFASASRRLKLSQEGLMLLMGQLPELPPVKLPPSATWRDYARAAQNSKAAVVNSNSPQ